MVKKPSKRAMRSGSSRGIGVAIVAFIGVRYAIKKRNALPEGIASGNGRLEGKLVDVAAKEPLRVKEILVDEGALVKPGQVLARLDTITLESELAEANASRPGRRGEAGRGQGHHRQAARARSISPSVEADAFEAAGRAGRRLAARARRARRRRWRRPRPPSARRRRRWQTATQNVEVARKPTPRRSRPASTTRRCSSPVTGRVLYRLAEAGRGARARREGADAGEPRDIYMEIFLPSEQAAAREDRRRRADHRRLRARSAPWPDTSASSRRRRSSRPSRSRPRASARS